MYDLNDLVYLMQRLRHPQTGCPWDMQQDFASVLPYTLEEAYEVADAIEKSDWPHLEEELGDLLFQVIFHGQIGAEKSLFDTHSIIHRLVAKLIRRHPHVFPDGNLHSVRDANEAHSAEENSARWQALKAQEKALKSQGFERLLDDVPVSFPALTRALKLQKKAASVGFDWPDVQGVLAKIQEEIQELEHEITQRDSARMEEEFGDLFFSLVNLARHYKIDPEKALRGTNTRFYQRFAVVEEKAKSMGGFAQLDLEQMNQAWREAKAQISPE